MNNEIQLANLGQSSVPAYPNQVGGGLGGYYGGGAPQGGGDENPLKKVHRLLRGRYLLAFVLGLLGAAGGAVAGYLSQRPAYKADAIIQIQPVQHFSGADPNSGQNEKVMTMFSSYIQSQMARLQSDKVVRAAMQDARWKAVRPGPVNEATMAAFLENLTISIPPRNQTFITVSYSSNTPESKKEVTAAVQSLLDAWKNEYGNEDATQTTKKLAYWSAERERIRNRMRERQGYIDQEWKASDGDASALAKWNEKLTADKMDLSKMQIDLDVAKKALADLASGKRKPATPEDWGRVDETMARMIKARNEAALVVQSLMVQFGGPNHPQVISRKKDLDVIEAEIKRYSGELEARYIFAWNNDGTGGKLLSRDLSTLEQTIALKKTEVETVRQQVERIRLAATNIGEAQREIDQLNIQAANAAEAEREWKFRANNSATTTIVNDGSLAKADKDKRPIFAAVGLLGGAGIPIGLLLLFGMFDTRYRFSDETATSAANSGIGGLTLLGILPNLPDRLSDPEQAAIAAHCVHQIRTMLQINAGLEDRRVFSVTSAAPGDGKTSLTLALGLSYAACGTRTLLIDCDLIGSGLSSRMNVSAPEGVLEAIANRSLMSYVRQTDVNDVSILPVGSAGNLHASTLSPQSLRRLIEEAEEHFEVVLIDTGPILGSIEASLVCAAADAVILTVARGQQRPMVEKSLGHLNAIGARLAGVVFNRAQAHDFERSISGVSMRSVGVPGLPRGARPTGPRLGPVARAVQGDTGAHNDTGPGQPPVE